MRLSRFPRSGAALIGLALLVAACGDSTGPLTPFQPQITNAVDNFQLQATGVTQVTWSHSYLWSNSGDSTTINQATTITAGTATVTISDPNGIQRYTQSLSANGSFGMPKGVAGSWTIRVVLTNYSGTLNFRVQKG